MTMGIYKIENKINGKIYIGSSKNIENRFKEHKTMLRNNKHHSYYLQNSWNKYGESNFEFKKIEEITNLSDLLSRESFYIEKFKSLDSNFGYNIKPVLDEVKIITPKDINIKLKELLNYEGDIIERQTITKEYENKHVKIYNRELAYAKDKYNIKQSEISFLYSLTSYLKYEDVLLVNLDGYPIMQFELADSLEIDRRTVIRNLNSLTSKKALYYIKDCQRNLYFVNPFLMYCGEEINPLYPLLFTKIVGYEPLSSP